MAEGYEALFLHSSANYRMEFPCQERQAEKCEGCHPSSVPSSRNRGISLGSTSLSLPLALKQWCRGFAQGDRPQNRELQSFPQENWLYLVQSATPKSALEKNGDYGDKQLR